MILLMGLPGSGKGTQGKMLADEYGFHLLSMGDLVRMYVTGARRQRMLAGDLLDDAEIITMVDRVLTSLDGEGDECVLDGFPRTVPQAEWLLAQVKAGRFEIDYVVYLDATTEAVKARLQARGRRDDQEVVVERRFNEYRRLTEPVIDWLKQHGVEILRINAEQPTDAVNRDIIEQLGLA